MSRQKVWKLRADFIRDCKNYFFYFRYGADFVSAWLTPQKKGLSNNYIYGENPKIALKQAYIGRILCIDMGDDITMDVSWRSNINNYGLLDITV